MNRWVTSLKVIGNDLLAGYEPTTSVIFHHRSILWVENSIKHVSKCNDESALLFNNETIFYNRPPSDVNSALDGIPKKLGCFSLLFIFLFFL